MPSKILLNVGWRYLLRHPWQSVLMVVGITLGVAMIVAIDLANASASQAFDLSTQAVAGRATHQIVGGPVNPPGVAAAQEFADPPGRQREHAAHVPPGQREDPRLQRVEHREQQMGPPDTVDAHRIVVDLLQIGDAEGGRDDRRGGTGDPVGRENQIVRGVLAGEGKA